MIRLRFIKDHGDKKAGDIQVTESPTTAHWLVDVHKVAVIAEPEPIVEPPAPIPELKFLRTAPMDKMVNGPRRAKSGRYGQSGGD
jgi:hypothetical protein